RRVTRSPEAAEYMSAIRDSSLLQNLKQGTLELEWAETRIVCDDPAKGLGHAAPESLVYQQFKAILGDPRSALSLVSPSFVPTEAGVEWFSKLAKAGVEVRILTNSLEATDVAFVHAGYAKRREPLLKNGIRLYELKRGAAAGRPPKPKGGGSSGASLHAK